jgi:hypothetical protein
MLPSMLKEPTHLRGALLTGLVCVVWILLANRSPSLTYHFAPLIAAVLWPLSLRSRGRRILRDAANGAAGAAALVLVASLGLHLTDRMTGPTFIDRGAALAEAILFLMIGAAFGLRTAIRERPGLLGGMVDSTV